MMIEDVLLRSQYKVSTEERLQILEAGLLHLEQHSDDKAVLETLLQELRSLKSDSLRVALDAVATLTQQLESLLESLQRQEIPLTIEVSDRLHSGLNTISQLVYETVTAESNGLETAKADDTPSIAPVLSTPDPWQDQPSEMDAAFYASSPIFQSQAFPIQTPPAQEISAQNLPAGDISAQGSLSLESASQDNLDQDTEFQTAPDSGILVQAPQDQSSLQDLPAEETLFQEFSAEENLDQTPPSPDKLFQGHPAEESLFQESAGETRVGQETPSLDNLFQEPSIQGPLGQETVDAEEGSWQGILSEENLDQESPTLDKLFQEPSVQESIGQDLPVEENLDQGSLTPDNLFQETTAQAPLSAQAPLFEKGSSGEDDTFQAPPAEENLAQESAALDNLFQAPSVQEPLSQTPPAEEEPSQSPPAPNNLFQETLDKEPIRQETSDQEPLLQAPLSTQSLLFEGVSSEQGAFQEPLATDNLAQESSAIDNLFQEPSAQESLFQEPSTQETLFQESLASEPLSQALPSVDNLFQEPPVEEALSQEPLTQASQCQASPAQELLSQNAPPQDLAQEPLTEENLAQQPPAQEPLLETPLDPENLAPALPDQKTLLHTPAPELPCQAPLAPQDDAQAPPSEEALFQETLSSEQLAKDSSAEDKLFQKTLVTEDLAQAAPAPETLDQGSGVVENSAQDPTTQENLLQASPAQANLFQETPAKASSDPDLFEHYQATNQKRLQHLESGLLQLATVVDDEPVLKKLLQETQLLKSDSTQVGLETMVTLAQQFENVLEGVQRKKLVLSIELCAHLYEALKAMEQWIEGAGPDLSEVLVKTTLPQDDPDTLPDLEADQPDQSVVDKIDALLQSVPPISEDTELREIYKSISEGRLQKLEAGLAQLEQQRDDAILAELLREAHSLKGDSRSVGVNAVEILTHNFEGILVGIQNRQIEFTPALSHSLYLGLAAIAQVVNEANIQPTNGEAASPPTHSLTAATPKSAALDAALDKELTAPPLSAETTCQAQLPPLELDTPPHDDAICVQIGELDLLMEQVEELAISRLQVAHTAAQFDQMAMIWEEWSANWNQESAASPSSPKTQMKNLIAALKTSAQANSAQLGMISEDLRASIGALKQCPLSRIFERFPRLVQDLANRQGKQVELKIDGEETTVDKRILEAVKDALTHLICNAVDHGVETSAERQKQHKPPMAKIFLRGYKTDTGAVVEVMDDGRGLDIEQIKQTALNRQLYSLDALEAMTVEQIHALIFEPGFSTRTEVTEVSGRGVGLDVVRTHIERLRGHVQIDSIPGQGCTFRLHLSPNHEDEASDGVINDPCFVY
ncbi:MAG: Hpt domain-containing protein [Leptolyngbyaceae cyanobacterium MO_188.B28]|nr:Hpt domain-containing protein [Leptolyngbyaceae cyanobacterium MO_188.B28]